MTHLIAIQEPMLGSKSYAIQTMDNALANMH
jgi:hypothetical protein